MVETGPNGYYRQKTDPDRENSYEPYKNSLTGNVYWLVNEANSSATFNMAYFIKEKDLGILAGQQTGGNLKGINGGYMFMLRLPNTGIEVDIPLVGQYPTGIQPDRGIIPDILIEPTVSDIVESKDGTLEAVINHIKGSGNK
jgi:C-terminal processing protease CtpA/Prc